MAGDIRKNAVLDFYGLPGCGKSTISHMVAKALREKGYSVYEPSHVFDHELSAVRRKLTKFRHYVRFSLCHPDRSKKIYSLVKENGHKRFFERLSQCVNIVSKYVALKEVDYDYIIFDEGFCQAAISLSYNKGIRGDVASNFERIIEIYGSVFDLKPMYLRAEIENALKNMKKRGGHDSRADTETDDVKRYEMVRDFYKLCERLKDIAFIVQEVQNDEYSTVESVLKNIVCK